MSSKTGNEQTAEIYDFLYRDSDRIGSYYAQIWNGRLLSVEESSTESQKSEQEIKSDVHSLSAESKTASEYQFQNKRMIDMHDAATVDLLLRLVAQRAERGVLGSIRSFSATCFFLDRNILKLAEPAIELVALEAGQKDQKRPRRSNKRTGAPTVSDATNSMKSLIARLEMPSGFVLSVDENTSICGPIKESGLDQPISSLLFRAGSMGLAKTYVIGLVEELNPVQAKPFSPMHKAQIQLANSVFPLLLPESATRMVPLAIYRKIPI